jgi:hypothetical protein
MELINGKNLGFPTFEGQFSPHTTQSVQSQWIVDNPDKPKGNSITKMNKRIVNMHLNYYMLLLK